MKKHEVETNPGLVPMRAVQQHYAGEPRKTLYTIRIMLSNARKGTREPFFVQVDKYTHKPRKPVRGPFLAVW